MKPKKSKKCAYNGCPKDGREKDPFCSSHGNKVTISRFLTRAYTRMNSRVKGKSTDRPDLYLGLSILPKDVFLNWARNHPDFLKLYKRWRSSDFDRRLTPVVNRMNSKLGYELNNMEWLTNSQNCGLSGSVMQAKYKKAVYELLGVK